MDKVIEIIIKKEDFINTYYIDIENCALCKALKRKFPNTKEITAGYKVVFTENAKYRISEGYDDIQKGYKTPQDIKISLIKTDIRENGSLTINS